MSTNQDVASPGLLAAATNSPLRRAAMHRDAQERALLVALQQLNDVIGRIGALEYPNQIRGHAIKTVADAVCDLEAIRNTLPNLLGTLPA